MDIYWGSATFISKGPDSTCFAGHVLSVTTTQLCHCSVDAVRQYVNELMFCKTLLQNQLVDLIWPAGHSFLNPDVCSLVELDSK